MSRTPRTPARWAIACLAALTGAGAAGCKDGRAPWESAPARSPEKGVRPGAMPVAPDTGASARSAADAAPPGEPAGATAPSAAGPAPRPAGPPGFDFRIARLDPAAAGSAQTCDVTEIDSLGPGRWLLGCWNGGQAIAVELTGQVPADAVARGQRIRVRVEAAGAESGGAEAVVRFVDVAGDAPGAPASPAGGVAPAAGFDFGRANRDPSLHESVQPCRIRSVDRIARVDPAARRGTPATWFDPARATHWVRLTCTHPGGTSRLVLGARGFRPLLPLRPGAVARVRLLHQAGTPQREAVGLLVSLAYEPPATSPW